MNIFAWIFQVVLAVQYLFHGWLFVSPPPAMAGPMASMGVSTGFRQFIGVAEILASVGLVLPALTRILPWLTPLAALGLTIVMISATIFHISRNEMPSAIGAVNLLMVVAVTAYLRWKVVPIRAKAAR
ncbi:MAG TPA: DoxX family protein [Nitrolancea sp.]|nr:DoxX family protein [Nitrolancea sp.]